jgi:hypothetical protein
MAQVVLGGLGGLVGGGVGRAVGAALGGAVDRGLIGALAPAAVDGGRLAHGLRLWASAGDRADDLGGALR